jgi:DNA-binding NarL/FixJ family response regulator
MSAARRTLKSNSHLLLERERWGYLTDAQREVVLMLARGYGIVEIAQKLKKSESAITTHKVRAFEWLALSCNADATAYALKYKLMEGTLGVTFYSSSDAIPNPHRE